MNTFVPDYQNLVTAAENGKPDRLPLYEHGVAYEQIERIAGRNLINLAQGSIDDRREFHRRHNLFYRDMGYDAVSFERGVCGIVQGGWGLMGRKPGIIRNRSDFEAFDFEGGAQRFFDLFREDYELMVEQLPEGMKAVGGIGNGVFEVVQDMAGYTDLCLMKVDDPELYTELFKATGDMILSIWERFLPLYGDAFAVCRIGDDLGYKASTLLSPEDIRLHIIPSYTRIVDLIHSYEKPFLLHSCGKIFEVMDDFIDTAGIDAKHSNEDEIAPFTDWVDRYGDRIGNFGGIDMTVLCQSSPEDVERAVTKIIEEVADYSGIAISSGNSIPDYVPTENYLALVRAVRTFRGENPAEISV